MKKIISAAMFAAFTLGSAVSASTLSIVGGDYDSIPDGVSGTQVNTPLNNVLDGLTGVTHSTMDGYIGASIVLNKDARLRVEVLGWEVGSSQSNTFTFEGNTVGRELGEAKHEFGDPIEDFFTGLLTAGVLDFSFDSADINTGQSRGGVTNTTNSNTGKNFFASFGNPNDIGSGLATSGNVLWLFYDDGGVAGDNHDDLVIRISAVPLPAGMLLLLTGVGALGVRRKLTAKA